MVSVLRPARVPRDAGRPAKRGSARPSAVSETSRMPISASASGATLPPWASASSWQPRQTPSSGSARATASRSSAFSGPSQGCRRSSSACCGPPMASTAS